MKGKLYGIGIGPGDPELLTLKATRILKESDIIAVPESRTEKGSFALKIVKNFIKEAAEIIPLTFPMSNEEAKKRESRAMNALRIKGYLENGKSVAFITIGDPMLYSTYIYLLENLEGTGIEIETIPGVSAFSAMAAAVNLPLVKQNQNLAVVSMNKETDIGDLLKKFDSLVFMKVSVDNVRLADSIKASGNFDVTIASKIGTTGEFVSNKIDDLYGDIEYLTTVIAKKRNN